MAPPVVSHIRDTFRHIVPLWKWDFAPHCWMKENSLHSPYFECGYQTFRWYFCHYSKTYGSEISVCICASIFFEQGGKGCGEGCAKGCCILVKNKDWLAVVTVWLRSNSSNEITNRSIIKRLPIGVWLVIRKALLTRWILHFNPSKCSSIPTSTSSCMLNLIRWARGCINLAFLEKDSAMENPKHQQKVDRIK